MGFETIEINLVILKYVFFWRGAGEFTYYIAVWQISIDHREGFLPAMKDVVHLPKHSKLQYHVLSKVHIQIIKTKESYLSSLV